MMCFLTLCEGLTPIQDADYVRSHLRNLDVTAYDLDVSLILCVFYNLSMIKFTDQDTAVTNMHVLISFSDL